MIKKIFFLLFLAVAVSGFWTCSKDSKDDSCSAAWASELSNEVNAMINAATVYGTDQSPANCNAYKQAAQAYLDALEPYGNCATLTGQDRVDWQNALDDAQDSVDALVCN